MITKAIETVLKSIGEMFPDPSQADVREVVEYIMNTLNDMGVPGGVLEVLGGRLSQVSRMQDIPMII